MPRVGAERSARDEVEGPPGHARVEPALESPPRAAISFSAAWWPRRGEKNGYISDANGSERSGSYERAAAGPEDNAA